MLFELKILGAAVSLLWGIYEGRPRKRTTAARAEQPKQPVKQEELCPRCRRPILVTFFDHQSRRRLWGHDHHCINEHCQPWFALKPGVVLKTAS